MAIGHVRKRGKAYSVVIELPRDAATNKRRQEWKSGFRTKKEAEAYKARRIAEIDRGVALDPLRQTLGEYLLGWIGKRRAAGSIEQSTFEEYERVLRKHILPTLGQLVAATVTPMHVDDWLGRLHAAKLGQYRVRAAYALVHGGLDAAVRLRLVASNPCDGVEPPRVQRAKRPVWDDAQVARFRALIRGHPLETLFLLTLGTGLRRGEVLGLRWSDIDFAQGELTVQQQARYTVAERHHYADPKSGAGVRRLGIPGFALAALRAYRATRQGEGGIVFRDRRGNPLRKHHIVYAWEQLAGRFPEAGLPPLAFHDLRHTNATIALAAGVDPKTVSERLGHVSARFTLDNYVHPTRGADRRATRQIDAAFGGEGAGDGGDSSR